MNLTLGTQSDADGQWARDKLAFQDGCRHARETIVNLNLIYEVLFAKPIRGLGRGRPKRSVSVWRRFMPASTNLLVATRNPSAKMPAAKAQQQRQQFARGHRPLMRLGAVSRLRCAQGDRGKDPFFPNSSRVYGVDTTAKAVARITSRRI